jgi:hypothetical protein
VALPSEKTEQEKLISILPHINYEAEGVDNKPTVQFSGINLQVLNGSGSETTVNGTGNLILGYDESVLAGTQTGSHNLLLGGPGDSYTSFGGIVGGYDNKVSAGYASILSGGFNSVSGYASTLTGGYSNKLSASFSTLSGGCSNLVGTGTPAVNATCTNTAHTGDFASIGGGTGNQAEAENSTVLGGKGITENGVYGVSAGLSETEQSKLFAIVPYLGYEEKGIDEKPTVQFSGANVQVQSGTGHTYGIANGEGNLVVGYDEEPGTQTGMNNLVVGFKQSFTSFASIVGGEGSTSSGPNSAVFGIENKVTQDGASATGGSQNTASGYFSSVSGGYGNVASNTTSAVSGGADNEAGGEYSSVSGGQGNKAQSGSDSISGGASNTDEAQLDSILGGANEKLAGNYEIYPAGP